MDPTQYLIQQLQHLKVGIVARESFLTDLSGRIKKAKKLFGNYDPENMDFHVFHESTLQLLTWLNSYVQNGIEKIQALDGRIATEETKLYYDASLFLGGKLLHGIFIPIPAVSYNDTLQDFTTQNGTSELIVIESEKPEKAGTTTLKPAPRYRSISLFNLDSVASYKECDSETPSFTTPLGSTGDLGDSAGDRRRRYRPPGGMYFTDSGSFPELPTPALFNSKSELSLSGQSESGVFETGLWNSSSNTRYISRPVTAMSPGSRFQRSLDEFDLGMSSSSERIRNTISDFEEFVTEMSSKSRTALAACEARSLENLKSSGNNIEVNNTTRKSASDTSVIVTFEGSFHHQPLASTCLLEFSDWPIVSPAASRISKRTTQSSFRSDSLLAEAVDELRKELSSRSHSHDIKVKNSASLPLVGTLGVSEEPEVGTKLEDDEESNGRETSQTSRILPTGVEKGTQPLRESLERKWMKAAKQLPKKVVNVHNVPVQPNRTKRRTPTKIKPSGSLQLRPAWDHRIKWKAPKKPGNEKSLKSQIPLAGTWKTRLLRRITQHPNTDLSSCSSETKPQGPWSLTVRKIPQIIDLPPPPPEQKNDGTWKPYGRKVPEEPKPKSRREPVLEVKDEGTWKPKGPRGQPEISPREQLLDIKPANPKLYESKPEPTYVELGNRHQPLGGKTQIRGPLYNVKEPFPALFAPKLPPTYTSLQKRLVAVGERPTEIEKTLKAEPIHPTQFLVSITVPSHVVPPKPIPKPWTPFNLLTRKRSHSAPNIHERVTKINESVTSQQQPGSALKPQPGGAFTLLSLTAPVNRRGKMFPEVLDHNGNCMTEYQSAFRASKDPLA